MIRSSSLLVVVLLTALPISSLPAADASTTASFALVKIDPLDPPQAGFFGKRAMVMGIAILAHAEVSDQAIQECARRLERQLGAAPEVASNLSRVGVQMQIIGKKPGSLRPPNVPPPEGQAIRGAADD